MGVGVLYEFIMSFRVNECGVIREHKEKKNLPTESTGHLDFNCLFRGTWIYDLPKQHIPTVFPD